MDNRGDLYSATPAVSGWTVWRSRAGSLELVGRCTSMTAALDLCDTLRRADQPVQSWLDNWDATLRGATNERARDARGEIVRLRRETVRFTLDSLERMNG